MKAETIIKRIDGSKVKITATFTASYHSPEYRVDVEVCAPKKRIFKPFPDTSSYEFRKVQYDKRKDWINKKQLELVTESEIYEAKIQAWHNLKP